MDQPRFSVSDLSKAWCERCIVNEQIPSLLYYYAKYVKHVEPTEDLITKTFQYIQMTGGFDIDLAMHDIVNMTGQDVITVMSAPDSQGRQYILYRKFYEDSKES